LFFQLTGQACWNSCNAFWLPLGVKKVKLSLQQTVEAHRVVRRRGFHISLDNPLTDGGKVVSLTLRPPFTPPKYSWYSFLLDAESTSGP
jgi:hypothetical protein